MSCSDTNPTFTLPSGRYTNDASCMAIYKQGTTNAVAFCRSRGRLWSRVEDMGRVVSNSVTRTVLLPMHTCPRTRAHAHVPVRTRAPAVIREWSGTDQCPHLQPRDAVSFFYWICACVFWIYQGIKNVMQKRSFTGSAAFWSVLSTGSVNHEKKKMVYCVTNGTGINYTILGL